MRLITAVGGVLGGWLLAAVALASPLATPRLRTMGVVDGLPSSTVYALAQDRQGYLWLATGDGLARYDGVDFKLYRHAPGDSASLPGNALQALHVDREDRVWVAVEGQGVARLDADRRGFSLIRRSTHPELGSDEIWAINSTADGAVWLGSFGGGLHRIDRDGRLTRYQFRADDPRSLPADNVLALATTTDGALWVGTTAGLARWDGQGFERTPVAALSAPVVLSLSAEADGRLWIGTSAGLDLREADGRIAPPAWRTQLSEPGVTAVLRDREGSRWIATRRGLNRERDGVVQAVGEGDDARVALLSAFEDQEGGLWFGSTDQGLRRLPAGWRHFAALGARSGGAPALANPRVLAVAAAGPSQAWLVGTGQALERLDLISGRVETVAAGKEVFPERRLGAVLQARDGAVWVGHAGGLTRLDPNGYRPRHWQAGNEPDSALPGPVDLLAEDGDGLLWSASLGYGLQARDGEGRLRQTLPAQDAANAFLRDPEQLLAGPDGALWLAGGDGLYRWEAARTQLQPVPGSPRERIFALRFQPPETLWLHRLGALEAYRWDGVGLSLLSRVDGDAGLPAVESGGLVLDRSGSLWLTTPRGLWRYDPVARRLRQFTERDGLPSQEFNNKAPLMTPSGLALAGTVGGLVAFDPARIRAGRRLPPLVLERLSLRRAEDEFELPSTSHLVRLQPDDRDLRISARLLSFADAQSHRYRFRLHDYDPDWIDTGASGERVFSRLEPGRYTLEVIAAQADGLWSAPRRLTVEVAPPWWRTSMAMAGFAGLLALLLAGLALLYRWRLKRRHAWQLARQRQELAEQNSEAKSRFLATLGHEIRTPMTGVLGMAELLLGGELGEAQRGRVQAIQRAGQHLLRLLNDALDLARIEAGKLPLENAGFDPRAVLAEVAGLLRPLAAAKGLDFELDLAADLAAGLRGDAARVRQIVFNLGSNAIKFTERGRVELRAGPLRPQGLRIEVRDEGPGLSAEQQARLFQRFEQAEGARTAARYGGSGLGLAICQELAAAMGGRIEVESAVGAGACFIVNLPLAAADLVEVAAPQVVAAVAPLPALDLLLVEDDAMVAEVLIGLLQSLGHRPRHAPQALAALALLATERFDAALLDLDLPGMDGLQLARLLRSQGRSLPLLALTARADAEAEAMAYATGIDGFLRKPVTSALLAAALAALPGLQSSSGSTSQSTR